MTIYLLNSLPNSLISRKHITEIIPVDTHVIALACSKADEYADYDDNIQPRVFTAISAVGHASTAALFSRVLETSINAHYCFKPIVGHFVVPVSRIQVVPVVGDTIYCGLFTPPRRLQEGEQWTEDDILQMDINWVCIDY